MDVQDIERKYEALLATQRETIARLVYERDAAYATIETLEQALKGAPVLDREDHQAIHTHLQRVAEDDRRTTQALLLTQRAVCQTAPAWSQVLAEDANVDDLALAEVVFDNAPTLRQSLQDLGVDPAETVTDALKNVVVRPRGQFDMLVAESNEPGKRWTVTMLDDGLLAFRPSVVASDDDLERAVYAACAAAARRIVRAIYGT